MDCPRYLANDGTPCNFLSAYTPLPFGGSTAADIKYELYSYAVIKKKSGTAASEQMDDETREWPRLVRPTLVRARHSICRMCTNKGKLEEIIFTQSQHGK